MPWHGEGSAGCSGSLCAKAHYTQLPTNDYSEAAEQGADFVRKESGRKESVLELNAYHIASATLIMMNAMVLGAETDYPDWFGWNYIENAFLLCFSAEVLFRLSALGPGVFFFCSRNPEIIWDMFDVVVVSVGLLDLIITLLCPGRRSMKVAMLFRIVRLLRLLRILRIFRFLKQLYLMAYGFTEAVLAICWVTIFMSFVLYMCGIVLARVYGHVSPEDKDYLFLIDHFGTVPGSMLTLFELMASPDLAVYEEVMEGRPFMRCFLIGFIIFGSFGMIALLTGVISESMFEKNQAKVEEDRADRESKRAHFLRACSDLFATMETDEHGAVVLDELIKHKDQIRSLVEAAGTHLTENELYKLLEALDADASGGVDSVEFENGVFQVCQDIRPMSILEVHHCVRRCHLSVAGLECKMEEMGSKIDGLVGVVELALAPESRPGPAPAPARVPTLVRGPSRAGTPSASLSTGRQRQGHSTAPPQLSLPLPPSPRPCTPSARSSASLTARASARSRTEEVGAPLHSLHAASAAPLASLPSLPLLPSLPASARDVGAGFCLGLKSDSATVVAECGEILFSLSQEEAKGEDNDQDKNRDRDRDEHGETDSGKDKDKDKDKDEDKDEDRHRDGDENEDRHRHRDRHRDRDEDEDEGEGEDEDRHRDRDRDRAGCRDLAQGDGDGDECQGGQGLGQGQSPGPGEDQCQIQAKSQQQRQGQGRWQEHGQAQGQGQEWGRSQGEDGQLRKLRQEGGAEVLEDFRRQLQAMARLAQAELELVESSQQHLGELLEHRVASVAGGGLALLDPQQEGQRSTPTG